MPSDQWVIPHFTVNNENIYIYIYISGILVDQRVNAKNIFLFYNFNVTLSSVYFVIGNQKNDNDMLKVLLDKSLK
jgi:hypothetical protein